MTLTWIQKEQSGVLDYDEVSQLWDELLFWKVGMFRVIENQARFETLFPSLSLSLCLSICVSISLSVSVSTCICLSLSVSIYLSLL